MEKLDTISVKDEKEKLLVALNKSIAYFQPFIDWNKEISNLLGWKEYYGNFNNIKVKMPIKYVFAFIISISLIVLLPFVGLASLVELHIPYLNFDMWLILMGISIAATAVISNSFKKSKYKARQTWYQNYINSEVYPKIKFTYKQMNDYYNNYNDSGDQVIPFFYAHPDDISKIIFYINTGRADTIKEAINCYVSDQQAQQMMQQQMQIQQTVNGTLYYAQKAANSARVAAIASTIDMFLR